MVKGEHDLPVIKICHPRIDIADRDQIRVAAAFLNFAQDLHDRLGEVVVESK